MKTINTQQAADLLREADNILILCHVKPDGDTLGSGIALFYGLCQMGKRVRVYCADGFPRRFSFLWPDTDLNSQEEFEPDFVVAVDVADARLLGEPWCDHADRIDLCIDHHPSNKCYAKNLLLDAKAGATVQLIAKVLQEIVPFTQTMARGIYTGLVTDTGCFRYSNTSSETLRIAADMLDFGVESAWINKFLFETKTAARLELEQRVLQTLEYHYDGKIVMMVLPRAAINELGVEESDLDGLASLPRQIEGVEIGITLKEMEQESYRISVRSGEICNASKLCAGLGGGGHARAAGCFIEKPLKEAKELMLAASIAALNL